MVNCILPTESKAGFPQSLVACFLIGMIILPFHQSVAQDCSCGAPCYVFLENDSINGVEDFIACLTIEIGPNVIVEESADVTLNAGESIIMNNDVSISENATVGLGIDPLLFCDLTADVDGDQSDACLDCNDDDSSVFPGAEESCDGLDNDCDGIVDDLSTTCYSGDEATRSVGECKDGDQICTAGVWGSCLGEILPAVESCDNADNDCDGIVDDFSTACYSGDEATRSVGECKDGDQICTAGVWGSCLGEILPAVESCDNADNDCDGVVDEELSQACYTGPQETRNVGECSDGVEICAVGVWGACIGEVTPQVEICDDFIDNDCDGKTDLEDSDCVEWQEWTEIFAVGSKVDGMVPRDEYGKASFIVETLNGDGIPVEVKMDPADDTIPYEDTNEGYVADLSTSSFPGVYGAKDGDLGNNGRFEFSNTGIVRIAWEDIKFLNGTKTLNDLINVHENPDPGKSNRQFGYKVLRSDDNGVSWVDLTSSDHLFQKESNTGLLVAQPYSWRKRNNTEPIVADDAVVFTDYSVQSYEDNRAVDRARVYWYKVVPYLDGEPLVVPDELNVIRVTLPPPNMALVHRMMANRLICNEMDKPIDTAKGKHYSCAYNGLGSKGLTTPWIISETVYDLGGDLLVDRFETSCNMTRGSNTFPSKSTYSGALKDFIGLDDNQTYFQGCVANTGTSYYGYEPGHGTIPPSFDVTTNWDRIRPGDCFGYGSISLSTYGLSDCPPDPDKVILRQYVWPGVNGGPILDCTQEGNSYFGDNDGDNSWGDPDGYDFYDQLMQSEFAAVYYHRTNTGQYTQKRYPGPGNNDINLGQNNDQRPSLCFVNLPGIEADHDPSKWVPRWFPLNRLFDGELVQNGSGVTLYDKTIDEILADPQMYDQGAPVKLNAPAPQFLASDRYEAAATPLGKIVASNNSKLPPLTYLSQTDMNNLCGLYSVEVGITNPEDSSFVNLLEAPLTKRTARKKETIAMSAWPASWDSARVNEMEKGVGSGGQGYFTTDNEWLYKVNGEIPVNNNATCNVAGKLNGSGQFLAESDSLITTDFPHKSDQDSWVITGSSSLDVNGNANNTERCVSRFGVQDYVGNTAEYTTDEIFCDFSQDDMWFGTDGEQFFSINASANSLEWSHIDSTDVQAWVLSGIESGRCSTVEPGGARGGDYTTGPIMNSIYDDEAGWNLAILETLKSLDQEGVLTTRNGDGYFLDFGHENLGPSLTSSDIMGIGPGRGLVQEGATNRAFYFNPATGLPLECPGSTCVQSPDNRAITTTPQITESGDFPGNYEIADFPTNNSQIYNEGLSSLYVSSQMTSPNPQEIPFYYVDSVASGGTPYENDDFVNQLPKCTAIGLTPGDAADGVCWSDGVVKAGPGGEGYTDGFSDPGPIVAQRWSWKIRRGYALQFIVGGQARDGYAGRYHFRLVGRTQADLRRTYGHGGRCVVMINEG